VIVVLQQTAIRSGDLVTFRCEVGDGVGCWCGSTVQAEGIEVDVELDVRGEVDWSDIEVVDDVAASMTTRDRETEIRGPVSEFNEDGVLTLRLGDGEIRLDTTGQPPGRRPIGVRVMVPVIEVFPTGI
jgi:hypothetical protein